MKYRIVLFIVGAIIVWQSVKFIIWLQPFQAPDISHGPASSGAITPVLVTVYYEALCPDSKNFVVRQLLPTINKASRLVNVSLVPYGKAKTDEDSNGNLSFNCQHGPTECLANKIHACAISKVSNQILLLRYISCMIQDNMIPELIGENCAKQFAIEWQPILHCAYSVEGSLLLKKYGELTHALNPKMTFVPTVLLDNKHKNQAAILKNLFKQVCQMFQEFPEECTSS